MKLSPQMKLPLLFSVSVLFLGQPMVYALEKPLLAVEGKVLYQNGFDVEQGGQWKSAKGAWEISGGVLRGAEKPEDKHGAVTRLPEKLSDFVLEYEFKFEGGKATSLSINAAKGHLARIAITPNSVAFQKDDTDRDGPDQTMVFARVNAVFPPGTWHKVRLEMVGDTLLGVVDDIAAWGAHELLKQERTAPGLTVAGQAVEFRNLKLSEASLNPAWSQVQAALPKPGEKMDPAPTHPTAAKPPSGAQ